MQSKRTRSYAVDACAAGRHLLGQAFGKDGDAAFGNRMHAWREEPSDNIETSAVLRTTCPFRTQIPVR